MDNFEMDITGEGDTCLTKALEIALELNCPRKTVTHYASLSILRTTKFYANPASPTLPENVFGGCSGWHLHHDTRDEALPNGHLTLMLCWAPSPVVQPLPYPMRIAETVPFVRGWLENVGSAGAEPDIDGDLKRGWRVFTGAWGQVAGCSCSVVGVQKRWAMYGK